MNLILKNFVENDLGRDFTKPKKAKSSSKSRSNDFFLPLGFCVVHDKKKLLKLSNNTQ